MTPGDNQDVAQLELISLPSCNFLHFVIYRDLVLTRFEVHLHFHVQAHRIKGRGYNFNAEISLINRLNIALEQPIRGWKQHFQNFSHHPLAFWYVGCSFGWGVMCQLVMADCLIVACLVTICCWRVSGCSSLQSKAAGNTQKPMHPYMYVLTDH